MNEWRNLLIRKIDEKIKELNDGKLRNWKPKKKVLNFTLRILYKKLARATMNALKKDVTGLLRSKLKKAKN